MRVHDWHREPLFWPHGFCFSVRRVVAAKTLRTPMAISGMCLSPPDPLHRGTGARLDLDLELVAGLRSHRRPWEEHEGVPTNSVDRPATPCDAHNRAPGGPPGGRGRPPGNESSSIRIVGCERATSLPSPRPPPAPRHPCGYPLGSGGLDVYPPSGLCSLGGAARATAQRLRGVLRCFRSEVHAYWWVRIGSIKGSLEKQISDPFWSQNSRFSVHFVTLEWPKWLAMGSKWAHFTCLGTPNGLGSFLEKPQF